MRRGGGTHEESGTLTQGGAQFSLFPLVCWESNPNSRVAGASPTTSPSGVLIPSTKSSHEPQIQKKRKLRVSSMAALCNSMAMLEGLITGCVDYCTRSTQDYGACGCDCSLSLSRFALSRARALARALLASLCFPAQRPFLLAPEPEYQRARAHTPCVAAGSKPLSALHPRRRVERRKPARIRKSNL